MTVHEFPRDHGSLANLDKDHHPQYLLNSVAEDPTSGFVQHYAALARWNLTGGGLLTWDGQTLTTTERLIWLPAGSGGSGHIFLPSALSIDTTTETWRIVYVRLNDAQMATTSGVTLAASDVRVERYTTYVPNKNDLLIGVKNNDAGDGRFYMADGRVVSHWRMIGAAGEPGFLNGWVNYGGVHSPASYKKTGDGQVELRGLVKNGTMDTTIFQLPTGYRPGTGNFHHTISLANSAPVGIRIGTGGEVSAGTPGTSNAWVALHNIVFTPLA